MKLLFLLFTCFHCACSLKILVYILSLGKSHIDYMDSLIDALVERGHTVDVLMGKANSMVTTNGTDKVRRRYVYGYLFDSPWSNIPHLVDPFEKPPRTYNGHRIFEEITSEVCEIGLADPKMHRWMSQETYDVGILSDFEFCGVAILEHYGIKTRAAAIALPLMDHQSIMMGLPNSAAVTQSLFDVENLETLSGRFYNLLRWMNNYYNMYLYYSLRQTKLVHKYLNTSLNLEKLAQNYDMIFVNANEIIERPRPISHKVKYIGGINMKTPKPVNAELDRIMSTSAKGVVIFSFGTQVKSSTFPIDVKKSLAKAFRRFPDYTFLWKYEKQEGDEQIFRNTTNLHFSKWLPQTDILNDKRTKGFISHVGLNSYLEASYAGVPIVAIPLFIDQPHNAESGKCAGTTYILDKTQLTEENIVKGLDAILNDESYSSNAHRIAKMLAERPNPAKQQFLEWVEFIAANPMLHKQLNQPGAEMGPFKYYCIDIILLIFVAMIITIYTTFKVFSIVFKTISRVVIIRKQKCE